MEISLVVVMPFVAAMLLFLVGHRLHAAVQGWLLGGMMAGLFALLLVNLPEVREQGALQTTLEWVPQLGLTLTFYLDGLSLLFGLVVTGIGTAVMIYAGYYFEEDALEARRFLIYLTIFSGSMLGLVLAGNLLLLFIAWEGTSISSFLLIGFKGKDPKARAGALQALMITGGGGLALLVGLILISTAVSADLGTVLASGEALRDHPWYVALTLLVLIGCFSKSAQFPLHFWLPEAMTAPTPASAFLHSATMVKAGVYLLARFYPVLGDTDLWTAALTGIGLVTMLVGAVLALRQRDLKGCLAFSTVSQLGALVALIGLPEAHGLKAAMVGILAHALYKGALFLVVGTVDHTVGTRNLDHLGGMRKLLPVFAGVAAVSGLSMAGVPPFFGFVAKETLLEAMIDTPLALAVVVISAALTVTMALMLFWDVFMGQRRAAPHEEHHEHLPARWMSLGPVGLAVGSLIFGAGIAPLITPVVEPAVGKDISLYLFPPGGINLAFMLSMGALALGALIFATRQLWLQMRWPALPSGAQVYQAGVRGVEAAADTLLRSQNGKIRYYLIVILIAVIVLVAVGGSSSLGNIRNVTVRLDDVSNVLELALLLLSLFGVFMSIVFRQHLLAALALGVAGYSIGGLFLLESAPDVALVQFLVETLATILIILILSKTSEEERKRAMDRLFANGSSKFGVFRDVFIATLVGVGVALFALAAVGNRPTPETIATWHLENALPQAGANDVVASIITDFRGMDTLIEITVFGMAALGVLSLLTTPDQMRQRDASSTLGLLLRGRRRRRPITTLEMKALSVEEGASDEPKFSTAISRLVARLVLPIALLISTGHILYAGSAPGDGFTAGVVSGLAVALWYVVFGYNEARRQLGGLHPTRLIGVGLSVALLNALLPLLFGRDFLAFTLLDVSLPAELKIASPLLFEVGIFLTVFGGSSAVMEAITHPKEVETL